MASHSASHRFERSPGNIRSRARAPAGTPIAIDLAQEADVRSAWSLAALVSDATGTEAVEVFHLIAHTTPSNLRCLLASPEGWTALADHAGFNLAGARSSLALTVH